MVKPPKPPTKRLHATEASVVRQVQERTRGSAGKRSRLDFVLVAIASVMGIVIAVALLMLLFLCSNPHADETGYVRTTPSEGELASRTTSVGETIRYEEPEIGGQTSGAKDADVVEENIDRLPEATGTALNEQSDAALAEGESNSDNSSAGIATPGDGGDGGSEPPKDRYLTITGSEFFGIEADGQSFVYVVDSSGSMNGDPIARALAELERSVGSLSPGQEFFVIFFNDSSMPMYGGGAEERNLVAANPANINKLKKWLSLIAAEGGTEPEKSLLTALALKPNSIYFLTDGNFDPGVVDRITVANTARIPIHTVSFVNPEGGALLDDLARRNAGMYLHVP